MSNPSDRTTKKRKSKLDKTLPGRIYVHKLASMAAACDAMLESWTVNKHTSAKDRSTQEAYRRFVVPAMMGGDAETMPAILRHADTLADAAVAIDPRLAGRRSFVRSVEGIELDVAAFMAGEEACCIDRRRTAKNDRVASGEPARIVISTDSDNVTPAAAAAFIAAARLAAQFVPLEVWWQGSWLRTEDDAAGCGTLFLVPLVAAGEMDFTRLQFVLCHESRDHASNRLAFYFSAETLTYFGKGCCKHSRLEGTRAFIPASGIVADAESVASQAARFAGFEPLWAERYNETRDTAQTWTAIPASGTGETPAYEITAEDRARWAKDEADAKAERQRQADARTAAME